MMFFVYQLHCMSPCSLIYLIITLRPPLGISEFAIWRYKMSPVWTWMESSQVSAQHCSRQLITWSCSWNAKAKSGTAARNWPAILYNDRLPHARLNLHETNPNKCSCGLIYTYSTYILLILFLHVMLFSIIYGHTKSCSFCINKT